MFIGGGAGRPGGCSPHPSPPNESLGAQPNNARHFGKYDALSLTMSAPPPPPSMFPNAPPLSVLENT